MGIKTVPLRSVEERVENMYEAVCIMSGQAKLVLDDRILQASIKEAEEEEDYGVFDEVKEVSPEDYVEMEKTTSVAVEQFIEGSVKWRKKEKIS
tara:strand:- start:109 stop:390 length:282 start_codon:yes stop_codon:yes gene_type:complete